MSGFKMPQGATRSGNSLMERVIEDPDGVPQRVQVNMMESPLSWLRSRKHVSERQYLAGERLRNDWEMAGLGPRVTMRWDVSPASRTARGAQAMPDATTRQLSARERMDGALQAAGAGLSDILWRVVCAGEGLGTAEQALGWPTRAGKLVLTLALDRIADYYRIA